MIHPNAMIRSTIRLLSTLILLSHPALSQDRKQTRSFQAKKITRPIKIDGILDEAEWNRLPLLTDFIQKSPYNGNDPTKPTIARVGFDDTGLYFGILCEENGKDSIMAEISQRDDEDALADLIAINLSPFNDGINANHFILTAAGVQIDLKFTAHGADIAWDAVWESKVGITDSGWVAEIKIPYSAIRFPSVEVQDWGINFWRKRAIKNEWSVWTYIPNDIEGAHKINGVMQNIEIKDSPLRLSLTPYTSSYLERNTEQKWTSNFNAGMDLKYGISESFTLDAILIPDFGQVQSDDMVLNLTPYEIRYNEKRQFFTEGTEMFNKGDIFYSRRIGSRPQGYGAAGNDLFEHEKVVENPSETRLINAMKFSGRTNKGLGIGVLNAMTGNTFASIEDTLSGETRGVSTQAFTNYNLIALDQNLFQNSYFSFINSNVLRKNFTANVSAIEFKLADNDNQYSLKGVGAISHVADESDTETGYKVRIETGKFRGSFQYAYYLYAVSDDYDQNGLGYLSKNNELNNRFLIGHHIYQPFGSFLDMHNTLILDYRRLMKPWDFTELWISYIIETTLKNNYYFRMHAAWVPLERRDYYEPRVEGRYFQNSKLYHNCLVIITDRRKSLSMQVLGFFTNSYDYDFKFRDQWSEIKPTYRINNQFNIEFSTSHRKIRNEPGFVDKNTDTGQIIFGKRNQEIITNTIGANYLFNNKASISFRLRHYWSKALYDAYYELTESGRLVPATIDEDHDINYSAFNIDMTFIWNFAPGSELRINWKNASYDERSQTVGDYWENLRNTVDLPHADVFSVKLLYYLDYPSIRRLFP